MKIKFSRLQLLIVLIIVNFALLSGIIILMTIINRTSTQNIVSDSAIVLPILSKAKVEVNSKAYIVYDRDSRVILSGKNENLRFAPASTAKIMTAVIALEHYPLDEVLKVSDVSSVEGSKMHLIDGEEITVLNLLYGLMLPSGNDAARVLAENFPGGIAGFVESMNKKAESLDMKNTKFFDPAGYDDNNYTTAIDLARLASHATGNTAFTKIVGTKNITVTDTVGLNVHELTNLNEMLGKNGVTGIKTGYTDEAGGVLVTSIVHEERVYIVVVLNSPDRFSDTKTVIDEAISKIKLLLY